MAIDYSQQSINAATYISGMLHPLNNMITFFHVEKDHFNITLNDEDMSAQTSSSNWITIQKNSIDTNLKKAVKLFLAKSFPKENLRIIKKAPDKNIARALLKESRNGYDLLVTGRSRLNRISGQINGTATEKLLFQTFHIPLVVVSGVPETQNILLGYESSKGSEKAVKVSAKLIRNDLETVLLCHILCDFHLPLIFSTHKSNSLDNPQRLDVKAHVSNTDLRKIEPLLTRARDVFINRGFLSSSVGWTLSHRRTTRSQALLDTATAQGCGTLILGRRGHSAMGEFLIGRVGQKALETVSCMAIWII